MKGPGSKEDVVSKSAGLPEPTKTGGAERAERLGEKLRALDQQVVDVDRRLAEEGEKVAKMERAQSWPCLNCGGVMRPLAIAGRRFHHRGQELTVPANFPIDTCSVCGEYYLPKRMRALLARKAR